MTEKIIVLTPDDTIELVDYNDYKSLQGAVNGMIELFHRDKLPIDPTEVDPMAANIKSSLPVDLFCNEEFLVNDSEEFDKINAVASLLSGQEIRGNVAMVVDAGGGENRGFEYKEYEDENEIVHIGYCECSAACDTLRWFIEKNANELERLHKQLDNHKSEPYFEITSWDTMSQGGNQSDARTGSSSSCPQRGAGRADAKDNRQDSGATEFPHGGDKPKNDGDREDR